MKAKNYPYVVTYGRNMSKHPCSRWKEACHFMKYLIDSGETQVSVASRVSA